MTTALDLFRGAGGWSVAAKRLGITDDGVEVMREANETAFAAGHHLAWADVWEPDFELVRGVVTGEIASPPCQTFSAAGKGAGRKALDDVLRVIKD
ncbi:MAG: DNA cytosine methyltransferase, partial [Actinomycetes bacterium]